MYKHDVGITDTVIHVLDYAEEKNTEELNSGGNKWKCYTKAFLHGAAIGLMDSMMVFGVIITVVGVIAGRKGKVIGLVDK